MPDLVLKACLTPACVSMRGAVAIWPAAALMQTPAGVQHACMELDIRQAWPRCKPGLHLVMCLTCRADSPIVTGSAANNAQHSRRLSCRWFVPHAGHICCKARRGLRSFAEDLTGMRNEPSARQLPQVLSVVGPLGQPARLQGACSCSQHWF